jgi:hypothetical protein
MGGGEVAGCAGVVEMDVRHEDVVEVDSAQGFKETRGVRGRAGIDEGVFLSPQEIDAAGAGLAELGHVDHGRGRNLSAGRHDERILDAESARRSEKQRDRSAGCGPVARKEGAILAAPHLSLLHPERSAAKVAITLAERIEALYNTIHEKTRDGLG